MPWIAEENGADRECLVSIWSVLVWMGDEPERSRFDVMVEYL